MKLILKYSFLLLLFLGTLLPNAMANNDATTSFKSEQLNQRAIGNNAWQDAKSNLKYTKKKPVQKKKKKNSSTAGRDNPLPPPPDLPDFDFRKFAQGVLIFLAVILLAFVVFKLVAGDAILVNKEVGRKRPISLEEIETNLEEADVEGFLKKALADQDYKLAVRLYYLAIIKQLSLAGSIAWKKDKTNGHYMNEMRRGNHPKLQEFRNVTRVFEYVWYSDAQFDGGKFEEVRTDFKSLLTALK